MRWGGKLLPMLHYIRFINYGNEPDTNAVDLDRLDVHETIVTVTGRLQFL